MAAKKRDKLSLNVLLGQAHAPLRKQAKAELAKLRRNATARRKRREAQQRELEEFIEKHWGPAIELYETVMLAALDLGRHVAHQRIEAATRARKRVLFSTLITLHARACLVASEVITLIRTGHGAGAYGRWRTLHDISVVSAFLTRYGEDAAVRFYDHAKIEDLKTARLHREIHGTDAYINEASIARMEQQRSELLARHGPAFGNDYGWAATFVGNNRPRWKHIEDHAEFAGARLHYRGASNIVHSNSVGTLINLRMQDGQLIAVNTPSDDGLGTPGFASLIPLMLVTRYLVTCTNHRDDKARLFALGELAQEAIEAFLERMQS